MSDKPILFSAPMVRALLAGTKTQTRRALTLRGHKSFTQFGPSDTIGYDWHFRDAGMRWHDLRDTELKGRLRIAIGDRLYVREHWRASHWNDDLSPSRLTKPAREAWAESVYYIADEGDVHPASAGRFRQGIHMPRWASRITLHVTDVGVQRLQDLSEEDARAEGATFFEPKNALSHGGWSHDEWYVRETASASYSDLWNSINGPSSWDANPWVAAYTFTVEKANIDQARAP